MIEVAWRQLRQPTGQTFGWFMAEPAQHDMRNLVELVFDRINDVRMTISMTDRPPGRDTIDQSPAIFQLYPYALRAPHAQRWWGGFHLRIGSPDMMVSWIKRQGGAES